MKRLSIILTTFIPLAMDQCAVTASPVAADGQVAGVDDVYRANPKPPTDGRIGANYTPAYAVNQIQFWHDFRVKVVEKELAAAKKYFGISTLRVYLHNINFDEEKDLFLANIYSSSGLYWLANTEHPQRPWSFSKSPGHRFLSTRCRDHSIHQQTD